MKGFVQGHIKRERGRAGLFSTIHQFIQLFVECQPCTRHHSRTEGTLASKAVSAPHGASTLSTIGLLKKINDYIIAVTSLIMLRVINAVRNSNKAGEGDK